MSIGNPTMFLRLQRGQVSMASNTLRKCIGASKVRAIYSSSSGTQLTKIGHIFYSTVFKCNARTQGRRFLVAVLIYTRKAANKCDFQILYILMKLKL